MAKAVKSQAVVSEPNIFGIRHHGPGSARSLLKALEELNPDVILVEGPPDATAVLPLLAHPEMKPPVALLIYNPDDPKHAVYYPFALFSPEWQALNYGLTNKIAVRFMDLPQAHQLIIKPEPESTEKIITPEDVITAAQEPPISADPLGWLAKAAGYSDGERWWEHMVEHRYDGTDIFKGILEAMTALRTEAPPLSDPREAQREAYMRQTIRTAQQEGFQRIAVVCGAWHGPALVNLDTASDDKAILKDLPKAKVQATWVPWTYGRLSYQSGYGAGIESPGWYHHLWTVPDKVAIRWLTRVAQLLRAEDLDASAAHVIETVRLSEALATVRDRPLPGLTELNEATQAVLCFGSDTPMKLIHNKLIVGETLGDVPDETPMVPLQQDFRREQKRLRLPSEAISKELDLDMRQPNQLEQSYLLHRLNLLGIGWGRNQQRANKTGTFREKWVLTWQPEYTIKLIEAGIWGNTLVEATTGYVCQTANHAANLPVLTELLDKALLAELPNAITHLMNRLQAEAAVASDIGHLMDALPALVDVLRYGNVRKTDTATVGHVVDGLIIRICVGLPVACASLNDEAAEAMYKRITSVNAAIGLLQNVEYNNQWQAVLNHMSEQQSLHGLLAGRCCRILLDVGKFDVNETARRMNLALSTANELLGAAAWVEGFIKDSGLILLHDDALWQVLDDWVKSLTSDNFTILLPLLRRTFATFSQPERRQIGERARRGTSKTTIARSLTSDFDYERANKALPLIAQLLGLAPMDGK